MPVRSEGRTYWGETTLTVVRQATRSAGSARIRPVDSCRWPTETRSAWLCLAGVTGGAKGMGRIRSDFKRVVRLLENGQAREALALAQQLVGSPDEDDRLDGYMCLGFVYEDGGVDLEPDFDKSLESYRRASLMAPNGVTFLNLARISLKRKEYAAALRFLDISAGYELSPETLLGYGHYFEELVPADAGQAKSYFLRAALRGRFAGFFGYARAARASGQHGRALMMDCARIVSGPFIALAIGARATFQF